VPRNWIGIRVSAVIAILGSALTLLFSGLMLFAGFFAPPPRNAPPSPIPLKPLMAVMAVVWVALSAWGISTAIAIFLRRRWARISILVFAGLLTFLSAGGMLTILFIQLPEAPQSDGGAFMPIIRWAIAAFYGVLTAIGVWWLVLFNRARTKEYFDGAEPVGERARPLSIDLIAWFLLISVPFTAASAILRFPAMFAGMILTGWAALPLYAVFGAAQIYCGTGLQRLREGARMGAIGYFGFGVVNGAVSLVHPGYSELLRQTRIAMPSFFPAGGATPIMPGPMWLFAFLAVAFCAVPIFFLVRRRAVFARNG
jgi:hypothetical protein